MSDRLEAVGVVNFRVLEACSLGGSRLLCFTGLKPWGY